MNTRNIMDRFSIQDIKRAILAQDGRNIEARRFVNMLIGGKKDFGIREQIKLGCLFGIKTPDTRMKIQQWFKRYQEQDVQPDELCSWFYDELTQILLEYYHIQIGEHVLMGGSGGGKSGVMRMLRKPLKDHIEFTLSTLNPGIVKGKSLELAKCPDSNNNKDITIQENWWPRENKECKKLKKDSTKQQVLDTYEQLMLPEDDDEKKQFVASARLTLIKFWYDRWHKLPQLHTNAEKDNNLKVPIKNGKKLPLPYVFQKLDECMQNFKPDEESMADQLTKAIKDALPKNEQDLGYAELSYLNDVNFDQLCEHFKSMSPQYFDNQVLEILSKNINVKYDDDEDDVEDESENFDPKVELKPFLPQAQAYFGNMFMYPSQCSRITRDDDDEEDDEEDDNNNADMINNIVKILRTCDAHQPEQAKCYLYKLYASIRLWLQNESAKEIPDESHESSSDSDEDFSRVATFKNMATFIMELFKYNYNRTPNNITIELENSINDIGYPEWVADLSREPDVDEIKSCEGWFGPPGLDVRDVFMSDIGVIHTSYVAQADNVNIQSKNIIVFHKMDCLVEKDNSCEEECRYVLQRVPFHRYPNKDIVVCDFKNNCVWKMKEDEQIAYISFDAAKTDERTNRLIKMAREKYEERQNQLPDEKAIASLARRVQVVEDVLPKNSSAPENMEGGNKTATNSFSGKSVPGLGKKTGQPVRRVNTNPTPALEKSLERVEKIIKARHVPCKTYHEAAKQLEEGIKKYYKHPYLENQIRKGIDLLERLYNVREKQSGARTGKRLYNRCFSLTGKTIKLGQYQFKIHRPMKGPRKNGRPKKTIDPNKPKRRKRIRLEPQFCDWKNNENKVDEKGLQYKACRGEDKKRRPCGVKRKGNWVLYNRGENCTKVNRGEKWLVKNDNNNWQAYQVKKPTKTNAPKSKRPRRTKAPKPSAKPLASSKQDQDQVSSVPFAKLLNLKSRSPGLGMGPIGEEELNDNSANNSLADPIEIFDSPFGQRKQSVIPSGLGEFGPIDLSDMSLDEHNLNKSKMDELLSSAPNNASKADSQGLGDNVALLNRQSGQNRKSIGTQGDLLGDDISLNALSSSNNASSQKTSNNFAQYAMQPSPTSDQVNSNIDFNNLDVENLNPDVLESMNNF